MLVPNFLGFEVFLVGCFVDLLEDILEASIVFLQDGILRAHVEWHLLEECKFEAGVCETGDRVIGIVLGLGNT